MGKSEITAFLTHLSASPNTKKLALNALIFLYNRFLQKPIDKLEFKYAKKNNVHTYSVHAR